MCSSNNNSKDLSQSWTLALALYPIAKGMIDMHLISCTVVTVPSYSYYVTVMCLKSAAIVDSGEKFRAYNQNSIKAKLK